MEHLTPTQWAGVIATILLVISETLPFNSKLKSNGIFHGIVEGLRFIVSKFKG